MSDEPEEPPMPKRHGWRWLIGGSFAAWLVLAVASYPLWDYSWHGYLRLTDKRFAEVVAVASPGGITVTTGVRKGAAPSAMGFSRRKEGKYRSPGHQRLEANILHLPHGRLLETSALVVHAPFYLIPLAALTAYGVARIRRTRRAKTLAEESPPG